MNGDSGRTMRSIVSAMRRSSMSSCGGSGYFSGSPPASGSPPVLCNPKSGEWLTSGPVSDRDCGGPGPACRRGSPGSGFSGRGRLAWEYLVTLCSWGTAPLGCKGRTWVWAEGELGCSTVPVKAAARPRWSSGVGMVFESCPDSG